MREGGKDQGEGRGGKGGGEERRGRILATLCGLILHMDRWD